MQWEPLLCVCYGLLSYILVCMSEDGSKERAAPVSLH